ncbi:MAG: DUF721 domain-containing protein [Gemmatimonadetes bacterium]|nr:DUF721 domain-containing protein [Gemmatimonadota bacterium]MYK65765.1 DUF721 domain-containing protein [Gemmatimonadota bacterium]
MANPARTGRGAAAPPPGGGSGATGAGGHNRGGERLTPLAEVLDGYLDRTGLGDSLARLEALDEWAAAVGERVSRVTRPVEVRGETLVVEVLSSAWINELSMMGELILERLNARGAGPPIGRIRFRLAETKDNLTQSSGRPNGHG